MSIRLFALLDCNTCPDGQFIPPPNVERASDIRRAAVDNGWDCAPRGTCDRCPDCVAAGRTDPTPR